MSTQPATAVAAIRRDGFAILPELISRAEVSELYDSVRGLERDGYGRNVFEGERSKRVYGLVGKGGAFVRLAEHPVVVELLDQLLMPNWLLSTFLSVHVLQGETRQPWHCDDMFYPIPRPRAPLGISIIWALDDFTADNGATQLIPGSHKWATEVPREHTDDYVSAVMPAGSALVFSADVWHRSGDNRSGSSRLALTPQYCQPWLRTQEPQHLVVPRDVARQCSPRMQSMLGYSIHPPFMGQVNGMHPRRVLTDDYDGRAGGDSDRANRQLEEPAIAAVAAGWIKGQ